MNQALYAHMNNKRKKKENLIGREPSLFGGAAPDTK
jgi:hypothetical protein